MRCILVVVAACLIAACGRIGYDDTQADASIADVGPPACGTSVVFRDELADTMAAPVFGALLDTGMTLVEANGHLDVVFAPTVMAAKYAAYESLASVAVDELCAVAELSGRPAGGALAYFKLVAATEEIEWVVMLGRLQARTQQLGTVVVQGDVTYAPDAHRFLRIRVQGGVAYWDTSADGITYVERASLAGFVRSASVFVEIGAGSGQAQVTNAGTARFEMVTATGP